MKRHKYIDEQTLHTYRKYCNNGYGITNWLRDVISDKTAKEMHDLGDMKNYKFMKLGYAGDFYQLPSGGKCSYYWICGHSLSPYIVMAFEI